MEVDLWKELQQIKMRQDYIISILTNIHKEELEEIKKKYEKEEKRKIRKIK